MSFLKNKKVLLSAGPTYEPIDPVRFIGNRSSGKMGYALAEKLAENGALVTLVSGPVNIQAKHSNITVVQVETAAQMYDACHLYFPESEITILAAAVSDYTVDMPSNIKIKKKTDVLSLQLIKTKDILKSLGEIKTTKQTLIGFALETNNELEHAKVKLINKNLDFIVLNSLQDEGAGFKHDTNKITIVDKNNKITKFELKDKAEVAQDIVNYIKKILA